MGLKLQVTLDADDNHIFMNSAVLTIVNRGLKNHSYLLCTNQRQYSATPLNKCPNWTCKWENKDYYGICPISQQLIMKMCFGAKDNGLNPKNFKHNEACKMDLSPLCCSQLSFLLTPNSAPKNQKSLSEKGLNWPFVAEGWEKKHPPIPPLPVKVLAEQHLWIWPWEEEE